MTETVDRGYALLYNPAALEETSFSTTVPQCLTCISPFRPVIEVWYTDGLYASTIIERLTTYEGHEPVVSVKSIQRHFAAGHCDGDKARIMMHTWQKADKLGVDIETYEETLGAPAIVAQLTVQKFRDRLADNAFQPDFKDGLAAAKLLHEMQKDIHEQSFDPNDMFVAISILMGHVNSVLLRYASGQVEEAKQHLTRLLESDPILRGLIEKTRDIDGTADGDEPFDEDDESDDLQSNEKSDIVTAELVEITTQTSQQEPAPEPYFDTTPSGWDEDDDEVAPTPVSPTFQ